MTPGKSVKETETADSGREMIDIKRAGKTPPVSFFRKFHVKVPHCPGLGTMYLLDCIRWETTTEEMIT